MMSDALVEHAMLHARKSRQQLFPDEFAGWIASTDFLYWMEGLGRSWMVTPQQLEAETPPSEKRRARTAALLASAASERERTERHGATESCVKKETINRVSRVRRGEARRPPAEAEAEKKLRAPRRKTTASPRATRGDRERACAVRDGEAASGGTGARADPRGEGQTSGNRRSRSRARSCRAARAAAPRPGRPGWRAPRTASIRHHRLEITGTYRKVAFMLVEAAGLRWRAFAVATARETAAELMRAAMFAELVVGRAREAECAGKRRTNFPSFSPLGAST